MSLTSNIHRAVLNNDILMIIHFLKEGHCIDSIDDYNGDTPLHKAVWRNNHILVKLLIAAGANINISNKFGETPLHFAFYKTDNQTISILLEAGANINARNIYDKSPVDLLLANI